MPPHPFHLAFSVTDLEATRRFFVDVLGCDVGREAARWVDFNFFGHQVSAHLVDELESVACNPVDGDEVPTCHFGLVLPWAAWHEFVARLRGHSVQFLIEPKIRFEGEAGEQATCFIREPSGNALEFKAFKRPELLFATA